MLVVTVIADTFPVLLRCELYIYVKGAVAKTFTLVVHISKSDIKYVMGLYDIYFLFALFFFVLFSLGRSGFTIMPEHPSVCVLRP